jgi:hypothetical protein
MDRTPFWLFVSLTAHKNPQKVLRNGSLPIPHPLKKGGGTIKKVQAPQAMVLFYSKNSYFEVLL